MLMIRLQRIGRKHDPKFRVIVTEKQNGPKSRRHKEIVGFYDAKTGERKINSERVKHWIGVGAHTSGTVHNFLVDDKIIEGKKINVLPKIKEKGAIKESSDTKEKPNTDTIIEDEESDKSKEKIQKEEVIETENKKDDILPE